MPACSFQMINQRKDVVFAFFYNVSHSTGYSTKNLLATTSPIRLLGPNDPQHIHLALTQTEGCASSLCHHETEHPQQSM